MAQPIVVITNTPTKQEALQIAGAAIERHFAAAINIVGPLMSVYRWEGKVETAEEWQCLIKTSQQLYEQVEQVIREFHSYKLPGIFALPVTVGSQSYLNWIGQETQTQSSDSNDQEATLSKENLLQELVDAHERLITAATESVRRGVTPQGEAWGPREILAHIAGWEALATSRIPQIAAGIPPVHYANAAQHAAMDNAINVMAITMIGDQSFESVCTILRRTYRRDVELLRQIDEALFRPGNYVYDRTRAAIEHCYEHAQQLEHLNCSY